MAPTYTDPGLFELSKTISILDCHAVIDQILITFDIHVPIKLLALDSRHRKT